MRRTRALLGWLTAAVTATTAAAVVAAGPASASDPPGPIAAGLTIATAQDMPDGHPYDVATTAKGTAFIGWIAAPEGTNANRSVHLCILPVGATACSGGVRTIPTDATGSAADLHVFAGANGPILVWFHDTAASVNGPEGAAIAESTYADGELGAAHDLYAAPSFGDMLDAEITPGGSLATVEYTGVDTTALQIHIGSATYRTATAPFSVGEARIAFSGSTAMVAVTKYGAVTTPAAYSVYSSSSGWSAFETVHHTWTGGGVTLEGTGHGLRVVTGVNNSSYRPVISAWNGTSFTARALTADSNSCGPSTHDGASDLSGRLVDVSWECNSITIANYADDDHAAIVRIAVSGTTTYAPQIAEGTRGIASVAYSVEDEAGGSVLRVSQVRLGTTSQVVREAATGGTLAVKGPVTCLPVSNTSVAIGTTPAKGWKVSSRSLTLDSAPVSSPLDGATLDADTAYDLRGTAVFESGKTRSTATVVLGFRTC